MGCTGVQPDREHFHEALEGRGGRRQIGKTSLRTRGEAVATQRGGAARNGSAQIRRVLAGGSLGSLGEYSAVTHESSLPLLRPLSTARIINADASQRPLSAQRPTHPEIFISPRSIAKRPLRLLKGVRSPESPTLYTVQSQLRDSPPSG